MLFDLSCNCVTELDGIIDGFCTSFYRPCFLLIRIANTALLSVGCFSQSNKGIKSDTHY